MYRGAGVSNAQFLFVKIKKDFMTPWVGTKLESNRASVSLLSFYFRSLYLPSSSYQSHTAFLYSVNTPTTYFTLINHTTANEQHTYT